jgi:hypothetical protein
MIASITISFPGSVNEALTKNARGRAYWATVSNQTRNERQRAVLMIREKLGYYPEKPLWEYAWIQVTQYWFRRPLDVEGLIAGAAPWIDAFQPDEFYTSGSRRGDLKAPGANVILTDSPTHTRYLETLFCRVGSREDARITVEVGPLTAIQREMLKFAQTI